MKAKLALVHVLLICCVDRLLAMVEKNIVENNDSKLNFSNGLRIVAFLKNWFGSPALTFHRKHFNHFFAKVPLNPILFFCKQVPHS